MEIRQKAVQVALAITSGAYQTSLLTYLIQRDMFPSVMKVGPSSIFNSSLLGYWIREETKGRAVS